MSAPRLRKKDPCTEEKDEVARVQEDTKDSSTSLGGKTQQKNRSKDGKELAKLATLLSTTLILVFICCKWFSVFEFQSENYESNANDQVLATTTQHFSLFFHNKLCSFNG